MFLLNQLKTNQLILGRTRNPLARSAVWFASPCIMQHVWRNPRHLLLDRLIP